MGDHAAFAELLRALAREGARSLVIGGLAKKLHGECTEAHDHSLWYDAEDDNAERVYRALARVGAPLDGVSAIDLADVDYEFRYEMAAARCASSAVSTASTFADAWSSRLQTSWRDVRLCVIGGHALRATELAERP